MGKDSSKERINSLLKTSHLKVAFLGARGIPACYGGFDTFVEELSLRLVEANAAEVSVYCRSNYYKTRPKLYRGVNLTYLPASRIKAIESLFHSLLSSFHVLRETVDIIFFVDPANAPFCALLRLFGKRIIIHTDGLGWKRRKWGPFARRYYKFTEWLCSKTANVLITDNPAMKEYYEQEYAADSVYIPYGSESNYGVDETVYAELGISPKKYLLVVARLEPENNTDYVVEEYSTSKVNLPLLIVGDSPYSSQYMDRLRMLSNERTYFLGRMDDQSRLNALYKGAYLYIHGHEVGGTNPSLLRAMYMTAAPLVVDVPFNTSVAGEFAYIFKKERGNLSGLLNQLVGTPKNVLQVGASAGIRARTNYKWSFVVNEYQKVFRRIMRS